MHVAQLEKLAEDLHLAVAVGAYTQVGAIATLAEAGGLTEAKAAALYRFTCPTNQANSWRWVGEGRAECNHQPSWGNARRIWEFRFGQHRHERVTPMLFEVWGELAFRHITDPTR